MHVKAQCVALHTHTINVSYYSRCCCYQKYVQCATRSLRKFVPGVLSGDTEEGFNGQMALDQNGRAITKQTRDEKSVGEEENRERQSIWGEPSAQSRTPWESGCVYVYV